MTIRGKIARICVLGCAAAWLLAGVAARAGDVAEEADLHFKVGAERYQARDYRGALEHFLLSNRLAPNRNVEFNIARTYEQLQQYAAAYRHYRLALEGETDAAARERVQEALQRMGPQVAVVQVVTDPPGATIYVDRKDLGAYGTAPRSLAFGTSQHRFMAELDGYEPAVSAPMDLKIGEVQQVRLALRRIVGTVKVSSTPAGASVRLDSEANAPSCRTPCQLQAPPGPHVVYLQLDGYETASPSVDVKAREVAPLSATLRPVTGVIVVDTDEAGALVEVDGRPAGYTPAVINAQIGTRQLRISRPGFETVERQVRVRKGRQVRVGLELERAESVSAASRVSELVQDAPSSVSVVAGETIRTLQYPTLVEALRGVRGVYVSDDRAYAAVGFRGLARLGDYGNRVLVLLDGHPINDDWLGSSYVGYDFRTDLDDVERIEVVRGAGSVVYGTNAFSGAVSVTTRGHDRPTGGNVAVSTAGYGTARARGMVHVRLGPQAGAWMSVAGAHSAGRDFYFPEFAQQPTLVSPGVDGMARGVDGFDAGTVHGSAWWGPVSLTWFLHRRDKHVPTAAYGTLLGDSRTRLRDTRGFLEARFEKKLSSQIELMLRAYYDGYGYQGHYAYADQDGGVAYERYRGAWAGGEARIVAQPVPGLRITAGGEGQDHFLVDQVGEDNTGTYLDQRDPYTVAAGYAAADVDPSRSVHLSAGTRVDSFSTFGASVNPRFALVLRPYEGGNLKLMGGRAFRAPSIYELSYNDGGRTQVASPNLKPESIWSPEVEYSQRLSTAWSGVLAGFGNYVSDLVISRGDGDAASPTSLINSPSPILIVGGEAELRREWRQGWMLSFVYSYQRARYVNQHPAGLPALRQVPNSPQHLGSVMGAVPVMGSMLTAASRLSIEGPRYDRYDREGDPPQGRTGWVAVWDVVLSGRDDARGLRYAAGVYNAFDWRYSLPVSAEFRQRTIVQNGRTLLLSAWADF